MIMVSELKKITENAWDNRELLKDTETTAAITEIIAMLDTGRLRVAEPADGEWKVNE
mgnify:CR=1 FL=1